MRMKVDVPPLQSEQFALPQTSPESKHHKGTLTQGKRSNQPSDLACVQNGRERSPFGALPDQPNWIAIADSMSNPMIENHAHDVSDLGTAGPRKSQGTQPEFNFSGVDADERISSPALQYPFV